MLIVQLVAAIHSSPQSQDGNSTAAAYFTIALVAAVVGLVVLIFTRTRTRRSSKQIRLIATGRGSCIASDRITVSGDRVGYMYRDASNDPIGSGWVFLSGNESQDYAEVPGNFAVYDVGTIANYDPDIIPFLDLPPGTRLERNALGHFQSEMSSGGKWYKPSGITTRVPK